MAYDDACRAGGPGAEHDECSRVIADVWLFLDDELDPVRRAAVRRHLDDCSPCLEQAGIESKLKSLLHRKCGGDQAPEQLRQRVIAQLEAYTLRSVSSDGEVVTTTELSTLAVTTRPVEPDA